VISAGNLTGRAAERERFRVEDFDGVGQGALVGDTSDDGYLTVWQHGRCVPGSFLSLQWARYRCWLLRENSTANDIQPSWSPDGTKIALASDRDQAGFSSIYVISANGTNQTRLTFSGTTGHKMNSLLLTR